MNQCDSLLQDCCEFLHSQLNEIVIQLDSSVLQTPLSRSQLNEAFVNLNWEPLTKITLSDENKDLLIDLTWKKCIMDLLSREAIESNDNEQNTLNQNLIKCAIILDTCFHSRAQRENKNDWSNTFFDLFTLVTNLLSWPQDIFTFWPYAESRLTWFKLNKYYKDEDLDKFDGNSNLISYKLPFSDKLRHWNDFLKIIDYNSSLNTPLHYKMKYKLEKFLTELLPINEESNYNRSATILKRQQSGNPWNNVEMKVRPSSSEEIFHDDYNYIVNKLIRSPIEFAFNTLSFKIDFDRVCQAILDAVFADEDRYYKEKKNNKKKTLTQDSIINENYRNNFNINNDSIPTYLSKSDIFQQEKNKIWNELIKLTKGSELLIRSTVLDISTLNPDTLYSQMTTIENDHFRKQFVLQLVFVLKFIENLVNDENVKSFYKNCYMKDDMLKNISFDDMDDKNKTKTLNLANHVIETRIKTFYSTRDPAFHDLVDELMSSDSEYLNVKIDNFKCFQKIIIPSVTTSSINEEIDYTFKKFGFIKFGNKQISNVWKIPTGLESIKQYKIDPNKVYNELNDTLNNEDGMDIDTKKKDEIVKQWQTLRSLRSQYLFEFNKVNEAVGLDGLFKPSPAKHDDQDFQKIMKETLFKSHRSKLQDAREYTEAHTKLKRKTENVETIDVVKSTSKVEDENKEDIKEKESISEPKKEAEQGNEVQKELTPAQDSNPSSI